MIIDNFINLQHLCDARTKDSSTKCLMFQAFFFFIISYRLGALKTHYFYYKEIKNKTIFEKDFARNCEKKNT